MLSLIAILFTLTHAQAVQEVIVNVDQALIHERSEESSDGLALAKKGTALKTSSSSRSGWYKVELPTKIYGKKYGWIKKSEVDPVKLLYPDVTGEEKKKQESQ